MTPAPRRLRAAVLAAVAALFGLTACSSTDAGTPSGTPDGSPASTSSDAPAVVFAAASLSKVFDELVTAEGVKANFSFDGSAALVDQLAGGAPADVFASADTATKDRAVKEGLIEGDPVRFATNTLVLVTPADNPAGITGLDASLDSAKLVICAPEVPCGRATTKLADAVGVALKPVSEETKVTDVLGKVTSGEADAGFVYATDAKSAGDKVNVIEIPQAAQFVNEYWVMGVKGGDAAPAAEFIALVTGTKGQELLAGYGFGPA